MPRIVSLIASATEIVCALGFEDQLVGRSHECDYPESVRRLPICTAPKFDVEGSSREIDQRVKALLTDALSVYCVDAERLRALEPDVIVTQSHCEVCAVSLRDVERAVCSWLRVSEAGVAGAESPGGRVERHRPGRGGPGRAGARRRVDSEFAEPHGRDCGAGRARAVRPTVACIEWIDPLMAAGNWMPELVELAGGANLFGEAGKHSPWMTWEQLVERDPDVIVVLPCGFDLPRTRQEMPALTARPEWPGLRAVRDGRVFLTDGNQYFNRPGPRLVESLEILAEVLHPAAFRFGHERTGWQRL